MRQENRVCAHAQRTVHRIRAVHASACFHARVHENEHALVNWLWCPVACLKLCKAWEHCWVVFRSWPQCLLLCSDTACLTPLASETLLLIPACCSGTSSTCLIPTLIPTLASICIWFLIIYFCRLVVAQLCLPEASKILHLSAGSWQLAACLLQSLQFCTYTSVSWPGSSTGTQATLCLIIPYHLNQGKKYKSSKLSPLINLALTDTWQYISSLIRL